MRPSNNLENKVHSSIEAPLDSKFYKTTTGLQSAPDTFDRSKPVTAYLTNLRFTKYYAVSD